MVLAKNADEKPAVKCSGDARSSVPRSMKGTGCAQMGDGWDGKEISGSVSVCTKRARKARQSGEGEAEAVGVARGWIRRVEVRCG